MSARFVFSAFIQLEGDKLHQYMDSFFGSKDAIVNNEDAERLASSLESMDEYHLVYSLEVGSLYAPKRFALLLPRFLSDKRISVVCAAINGINRLPDECISSEVLEETRRTKPRNGMENAIAELTDQIGNRLAKM